MKPVMRRRARRLALQAVYQWQLTANSIDGIIEQFHENINPKKIDVEYFTNLINGVILHINNIDNELAPCLDRAIAEVNPVELAILRIAVYELIYQLNVPYKVIINEALELAKIFGAVAGFKYVNGVLDKAARNIRKNEIY